MAKFTYTATKDGKTINGAVEAATKQTAIATLAQQNIHPVILKEHSSKAGMLSSLTQGRVRQKDIVVFTRQLSTMVSAGVPLTRSLSTLQQQTESKRFGQIVGEIAKEVEGGSTLADAFSKHPSTFNEIYVSMVRAGEAGGILDDILKRLASQLEKDASIRKKIKSAMTYPTVILSITVIAFFGIMMFVIPKLGAILKDLGGEDAELPVYTQAMLSLSDFLRGNAIVLGATLFIAVFLLRKYIKTPKGKYRFHLFLLRIPVIKTVVIKVAIARFSRTFASLMSSGVSVLDALQVTGGAIGNKVIERELIEAAKEVKNGKQLSQPLSVSPHFPPIVSQMLAVGEETGQIDTILVKVADFYEEEVDATIDGLSSLIEPLMIIVLGSMVGMIAASVMGPIASLSKNVGN